MKQKRKIWRLIIWLLLIVSLASLAYYLHPTLQPRSKVTITQPSTNSAMNALEQLPVKEEESGEDYARDEFLSAWGKWRTGCNVRQKILGRDVTSPRYASNGCTVIGGTLNDPYSGQTIELHNKSAVTHKVQVDHVVALSNAWRTGAKHLSADQRKALANDDLELIAVSAAANQDKSDGDASEWLPENVAFRCEYVARQIAVKLKYQLWVTLSEKSAMIGVLKTCPDQTLPTK